MLKLPEDARTAAFRAIVAKLRADEVLNRVVQKWKAIPFHTIEPTLSDLPYVIIGLAAGPIAVGSPESHVNSLTVSIKYAVSAAGQDEETAWADVINLYGQIERTLSALSHPTWLNEAIQKADATAQVYGVLTITKAGYTSIPVAGVNAIQAETVVSVPLKIRTCKG